MTVNESDVRARIACLQRTGCNKTIAWSRSGSIAYVYGPTVRVRHLVTKDGKTPSLSTAMTLGATGNDNGNGGGLTNGSTSTPATEGVNDAGSLHPMVHVSWSPNGSDVACVDSQGDISIYSSSGNHPNGLMTCLLNRKPGQTSSEVSTYELNAIVGFKWLDADKALLIPSPAMVNSNSGDANSAPTASFATYGVSQAKHCGPFTTHNQKNACVAISRKGLIRLIFQVPSESSYYEVSTQLYDAAPNTNIDLISHASFKSTRDNSLLLATYSTDSSNLKLYSVSIDWPTIKQSNNNGQQGASRPELASISVKPLLKTSIAPPKDENNTNPTNDPKYLTHLFLVPTLPQVNKSQHQPPPTDTSDHELFAIFASTNGSIVQNYHISHRPMSLHPSFYSLSVRRRDSVGSADDTEASLVLFNSYTTDYPILTIGTACQDTFMYTFQVNGQVDVEKRPYNLPLHQQHQQQQRAGIVSLSDAGYVYPELPPDALITDICMSPNMVSYVHFSRGADKDLDIKFMSYPKDYRERENFVRSVVGLALRVSVSCFSSYFMDDICFVTKSEAASIAEKYGQGLADRFIYMVLQESYRSNNFTVNIPKDYQTEKIFVNPSLQRLLSIQLAMGTQLGFKRDCMSRVGWSILNLRLMSFAITFTLRAISPRGQQNSGAAGGGAPVLGPYDFEARAQHIQSLTGLLRWLTDFLSYICQELYLTSLERDPQGLFKERRESVAFAALLGRIPRALLLYCLRGIRGLEQMAAKFSEQENNPIGGYVHSAYRSLRETIQMSPVSLSSFEKMVSDIDNSMKNSNPPSNETLEFEQNLIFKAVIPPEFTPICLRILQVFSQNLKPEINMPVLYFYDVSWLGLDPPSENESENRLMSETDVLRKTVLPNSLDKVRRKCSRCGGTSTWDDQKTVVSTHWTVAFQRNCLCGGSWYRG
ncbi:hypothetical protein TRICI_004948 [Trichomonascus ciferrii]|uniref:Mediator of RNA polymerase II transcription subunit 16 n=1 Tax=Trichomonascus ciferrii TaxID=44093 RepID=A0A642UZP8_9ASCO|nr:hypothetical protein TRICI_004948 [Trichomonascus ciferrii]